MREVFAGFGEPETFLVDEEGALLLTVETIRELGSIPAIEAYAARAAYCPPPFRIADGAADTREALAEALRAEIPKATALVHFHGIWGELPGHPAEDWRYEVANGDTRLGYWDWVVVRQEIADALASDPIPD